MIQSRFSVSTKTCFRCSKMLPLSGFYQHPRMKDGHLNKCIECTKSDMAQRRALKLDAIREYDRKRGSLPHRKRATSLRAKRIRQFGSPEAKAKLNAASKRYAAQNPQKRKAHSAVSNAIRDGKLFRQPCMVCGRLDAQAHHSDYSRPLHVEWLCSAHHAELHKRYRSAPKGALQYALFN